ncbi:hypothetical protein HHK36_001348 [Tetracentron sinense]|uniref:Uncharacterized protein n=1 Tax=Tetracentron sinense TaxID=13715 RepID=A0A834ZVW1_TETSI|nr:hypothetical protein HHK36_001348 [Tetracentron sinense]
MGVNVMSSSHQAPQQTMAHLAQTMPHMTATQDVRTVIIKATYREYIIRSRPSLTSGAECMVVARLSGGNMIRLLVHDIIANFGSSCESSG